jgi:hypothetical protein
MADHTFAPFGSFVWAMLVSGCQSPPPAACETVGAAKLLSRIADIQSRAQAKVVSGDLDAANLLVSRIIKEATVALARLSESRESTNVIDHVDRSLALAYADYSDRQGMHEEAVQQRLGVLRSYVIEIRTKCQIAQKGSI